MNSRSCVFVIDESGSKGYSDLSESTPGELGVIAGFYLPESRLDQAREELAKDLRFSNDEKVHITSLTEAEKHELRTKAFKFIRRHNIYWSYDAIYVQGFHDHFERLNSISKRAFDSRRSDVAISWRPTVESLHDHLFQMILTKGMGFAYEAFQEPEKLMIVTDHVDDGVLKAFQSSVRDFLEVGNKKEHTQSGYNRTENKVVFAKMEITSNLDEAYFLDTENFEVSVQREDTSLTLVADVLANSVWYHLSKLQEHRLGADLNEIAAIASHPLSNLCYGFMPSRSLSDALFSYPREMQEGSNT